MGKKTLIIRDPVHGDIELTGEEARLLDTWPMQRLRGIHQLGTARLVYPGATHTRFEHSIGTMHMTGLICRHVRKATLDRPTTLVGIEPEEERILRCAALVHDLGHIPFGHNLEDQTGLLSRHDSPDRVRDVILGSEVGELLESFGILAEVLAVLGAGELEIPSCWREIIADTICADILDYLARDSLYTGLTLQYDRRMLNLFCIERASGHLFINTQKDGMLREDALSEVVRVLEARYYFSERVYYHHAKITAGALVSRAVEEAMANGELTTAQLQKHTDDSLIAKLAACETPLVSSFAASFQRRSLPKRAAVYPYYLNQEHQASLLNKFFTPEHVAERHAFEQEIEKRVHQSTGRKSRVLLYCPAKTMQLKESGIHVRMPGTPDLHPLSCFSDRVKRVADLEENYRRLWKLYLLCLDGSPTVLAAAAAAAKELLPGVVNAYALPNSGRQT